MSAFDQDMNLVATILVRDASKTADAYGQSDPAFTAAVPFSGTEPNSGLAYANPWPCSLSLGKGRAKLYKAEKKVAVNYREIFMRPWLDSDGNQLAAHHWIKISGPGPDGTDVMYQVFQVDNPGGLSEHFEVWTEIYTP